MPMNEVGLLGCALLKEAGARAEHSACPLLRKARWATQESGPHDRGGQFSPQVIQNNGSAPSPLSTPPTGFPSSPTSHCPSQI